MSTRFFKKGGGGFLWSGIWILSKVLVSFETASEPIRHSSKKKKEKKKMNKTEKVINRRVQIASLSNEKFYRFFKIKSCSGTLSFHSISTLGRLNNTTTKSRRTGKKSNTEVGISKTRTFHEPLHAFLYIS